MVVAHHMQNAVEYENAYFLAEGAAEAASVAAGDDGGDGDIAEIGVASPSQGRFRSGFRLAVSRTTGPIALGSIGWKGQYIRGPFLAPVSKVPAGHFSVVNQADGESASRNVKTEESAVEKLVEFSNRNTNAALAIEDHGDGISRDDSCRRNGSCGRSSTTDWSPQTCSQCTRRRL